LHHQAAFEFPSAQLAKLIAVFHASLGASEPALFEWLFLAKKPDLLFIVVAWMSKIPAHDIEYCASLCPAH
jgi:hypothetical protein